MLLGMLMILSVVLTGCSSGEDGDNIIDVSQSRASAMTITLYSIVEDGTTEKAKQAVQDKLNEITENKYNTHVILKLYTESEYDNVIEKQIATIKADMDLQAKLKAASDVAKKAARSAGFSIASATTTEAAAPETDANGETAAETSQVRLMRQRSTSTALPILYIPTRRTVSSTSSLSTTMLPIRIM